MSSNCNIINKRQNVEEFIQVNLNFIGSCMKNVETKQK